MSILLTPARIGGLQLKNRIVMPPMTTRTADAEGHVTDATIAYYMARVRGGAGNPVPGGGARAPADVAGLVAFIASRAAAGCTARPSTRTAAKFARSERFSA